MFGDITTYQLSDMYYFSKDNLDGDTTDATDVIKIRFNDGGTADVSGGIKFRLSTKNENQLLLHNDFKSFDRVKHDVIRQTVAEAMMQTATLMKAEESYSTRRSEFTSLVEDQVKNGIYETEEQALEVDRKMKEYLIKNNISFHEIDSQDSEKDDEILKVLIPFHSFNLNKSDS